MPIRCQVPAQILVAAITPRSWAQRIYAGGCNLNRPIRQQLVASDFEIESLENFYMDSGFKSQSYMYLGTALNNKERRTELAGTGRRPCPCVSARF